MSRVAIQDEFTNLSISRQRKYQLRMARDGRCTKCGQPAVSVSLCENCLKLHRESRRAARQEKLARRARSRSKRVAPPQGLRSRQASSRKPAEARRKPAQPHRRNR